MISSENSIHNDQPGSRKTDSFRVCPYPSLIVFIFIVMLGAFLSADSASAQYQMSITGLEVNQVLGVQKDNNKYFVAGKNTVVRAFLNPAVAIDSDPAQKYACWL